MISVNVINGSRVIFRYNEGDDAFLLLKNSAEEKIIQSKKQMFGINFN